MVLCLGHVHGTGNVQCAACRLTVFDRDKKKEKKTSTRTLYIGQQFMRCNQFVCVSTMCVRFFLITSGKEKAKNPMRFSISLFGDNKTPDSQTSTHRSFDATGKSINHFSWISDDHVVRNLKTLTKKGKKNIFRHSHQSQTVLYACCVGIVATTRPYQSRSVDLYTDQFLCLHYWFSNHCLSMENVHIVFFYSFHKLQDLLFSYMKYYYVYGRWINI